MADNKTLAEINKQIALQYVKLNKFAEYTQAPGQRVRHLHHKDPERIRVENEELDEFIQAAYGVALPKKVITPGHSAPFSFLSDLFFERVKNALGFANRNGGKALALDTPVLTVVGWSTMGDIKVGDKVYAPDGTPTEVVWAGDILLGNPCFDVHFEMGETITADAEHLWVVKGKAWNHKGQLLKTTRELYEDIQTVTKSSHKHIFYVSPTAPIQRDEVDLPVPPYVLGAWLGDGSTGSNQIHNDDPELIEKIEKLWPIEFECLTNDVGTCKTYKLIGFHAALKEAGIKVRSDAYEKQIPIEYLYASVDQRLELLRGLLDTDGNIKLKRAGVEFNSTVKNLAAGVYWLAKSLGWLPGFHDRGPGYYKNDAGEWVKCKNVYRVLWRPTDKHNPFSLSRKANALVPATYDLGHKILSITPRDSVPVRCIKVKHPSSQFLVGHCLIPTHNTLAVAVLNHLDMVFKNKCEIASAGATLDQANKCYRYFQAFCEMPWFLEFSDRFFALTNQKFLQKFIQSYTSFGNGSIQEVITGSEKGLRSPHPHKARIDEIDLIDWEVLQTGLSMARSSDGIRGQNVFTSTRQLSAGSMQKLLSSSEEKGIKVYEWNIWEVVEKCTRRCKDDPEHGTCPIYIYCKGRAHHCAGFYKIDDFIDKVRIIDRTAFETEWENKKPSRHKLVYNNFDTKHIMTPEKLMAMCGVNRPSQLWGRIGGLDFGSAPGHPFVYLILVQLPTGQWLIYQEYVAQQRLLRDHASAIKNSWGFFPSLRIFSDWDAQDRLELRSYGIHTRAANKEVTPGVDYIRSLLSGYPPLEEPVLYVWYECTHTISEFNAYSWPVRADGLPDRTGNPAKYNDHCMDSLRYALYTAKTAPRNKYRGSNVSGL